MALVVQQLPNTEFAQHVQPHAIGAMCWCLLSNVLQHFGVWRHCNCHHLDATLTNMPLLFLSSTLILWASLKTSFFRNTTFEFVGSIAHPSMHVPQTRWFRLVKQCHFRPYQSRGTARQPSQSCRRGRQGSLLSSSSSSSFW